MNTGRSHWYSIIKSFKTYIMKTILLATDFSPAALNAAHYAKDMAISIKADLLLVHVIPVPVTYTDLPVAVSIDDMLRNTENEINALKDNLAHETDGKLHIETEVRMGVFFHELQTVCFRVQPYAVVMGSQGKTAAERFLLGGHTVHAMQHLAWPLITVPKGATYAGIKKIGFACDFAHVVDTTPVDELKTLVSDFHAELHVLNTGKKEAFNPDIVFESGLLQEMLENLKPVYHFITHDNIDQGIMDFTEKNNINLLIVLPKRHGLLEKIVHKSHTKELVLHSHVPVMALHQQ